MIEAATCPEYVPDINDTSVVDFSEGQLFSIIGLFEQILTVKDNPLKFGLNDAIDVILPNGTIQKEGMFSKIEMESSSVGYVDVEFSNLTVYGLDKLSDFFLLQ